MSIPPMVFFFFPHVSFNTNTYKKTAFFPQFRIVIISFQKSHGNIFFLMIFMVFSLSHLPHLTINSLFLMSSSFFPTTTSLSRCPNTVRLNEKYLSNTRLPKTTDFLCPLGTLALHISILLSLHILPLS
jgi:hypothetical protein